MATQKYPKTRITDIDRNDEELRGVAKKLRREKRALRAEVAGLRAQMTGMVRPTFPTGIVLVFVEGIIRRDEEGAKMWRLVERKHDLSGTSYEHVATVRFRDACRIVDATVGVNGITFLMGDPRENADAQA